MPRPFPEWASDEIARLRAEADALEKTLERYLASVGGESRQPRLALNGHSPAKPYQPRVGKTKGERILEAIKSAGSNGMALVDLVDFTAREMQMNHNSTRSQLWHMERDRVILRRDGRVYYVEGHSIGEAGVKDPGAPAEH